MKYSSYAGFIASLLLVASCFLPWVYIPSINTVISGFKTENTNFGMPGLLHSILAFLAIIFFLLPFGWSKRTNLFICTFNFAWAVRNFLLMSQCLMGECPEKKAGVYLILLFSVLMLVMAVLPKAKLPSVN